MNTKPGWGRQDPQVAFLTVSTFQCHVGFYSSTQHHARRPFSSYVRTDVTRPACPPNSNSIELRNRSRVTQNSTEPTVEKLQYSPDPEIELRRP